MLVEVIKKNLPYVGALGTVREIPDNEARVHILLGNVKPAEKAVEAVVEKKAVRKKATSKKSKKKGTYKRRDMVAEPVFVALDEPNVDSLETEEPREESSE